MSNLKANYFEKFNEKTDLKRIIASEKKIEDNNLNILNQKIQNILKEIQKDNK